MKYLFLFLFIFFILVPVEARVIRGNNFSPFSLLDFEAKVEIIEDIEPDYKQLGALWEGKVGRYKKLEKISFLVEVLNLVNESMIFDEENFKVKYPSFWQDIEDSKLEILNNPDKREEIIQDLLWERLDRKEATIFRVVAKDIPGFSGKKLLFHYINDINSHFIFHFISNPEDQLKIRDFISTKLDSIGIPPVNYLKELIPKYLQKLQLFIEESEVEPEYGWNKYVNFINNIPEFLYLLKVKGLYNYTIARKIFEMNLNLATDLEEINYNFQSVENLIQKLPKGSPISLLHHILDNSFNYSEGNSKNYQNNNQAISDITEQLSQANIFSSNLVEALLNSAVLSSNKKFNIYIANLGQILEFIECIRPFKYALNEKGKKIKDILENEIPQIAEQAGDNYAMFRERLWELRFELTGIRKFKKEEIERIQMMVDAVKRIEKDFDIQKIGLSTDLVELLKSIIGDLKNKKNPKSLEQILDEYVNKDLPLSQALDFTIHTQIGDFNFYKPSYKPGLVSLKLTFLHLLGETNIKDFPEEGIGPKQVYKENELEFKYIPLDLQSWLVWDYYFKNQILINPEQYRGYNNLYIYVKNLLEQGKLKDSNLAHYQSLLTKQQRKLLEWVESINLKVETIDKYKSLITEEKIETTIDDLLKEHIRPTKNTLVTKLGISTDVLTSICYINNIRLDEILDFPEIEEILHAERPLTEKDIEYFLSLVNINGLYLDEIIEKFFFLDELGRIKTIKREALNNFVYGGEFRKIGDLVFTSKGFKSFINDIHDASDWVKNSFIILGPKKYDLFGLKPEEVGRYGQLIAISRSLFPIRGREKIPLPNPYDSQSRAWRFDKHKIPFFLIRLFISGAKRMDGSRGVYKYRIIDDKGDIIAEFDRNREILTAIFVKNESRTGWIRWDPLEAEFKEEFGDRSSLGQFLNDLVQDYLTVSQ